MIDGAEVERVQKFSFFGTIIREDLSCTRHISRLVDKAQ